MIGSIALIRDGESPTTAFTARNTFGYIVLRGADRAGVLHLGMSAGEPFCDFEPGDVLSMMLPRPVDSICIEWRGDIDSFSGATGSVELYLSDSPIRVTRDGDGTLRAYEAVDGSYLGDDFRVVLWPKNGAAEVGISLPMLYSDLAGRPAFRPLAGAGVQVAGENIAAVAPYGWNGSAWVRPSRELATYSAGIVRNVSPRIQGHVIGAATKEPAFTVWNAGAKVARIHQIRVSMWESTVATAAWFELQRISTAPAGGAVIAPDALDTTRPAATLEVRRLATPGLVGGVTIRAAGFNLGAVGAAPTATPAPLAGDAILWDSSLIGDGAGLVIRSGEGVGVFVTNEGAATTLRYWGVVTWTEE